MQHLPPLFLAYWFLLLAESRSLQAARRELLRRWRSGEIIPGYGTFGAWHGHLWPEKDIPTKCPPDFVPHGWSGRNLRRHSAPRAELRLVLEHGVSTHAD